MNLSRGTIVILVQMAEALIPELPGLLAEGSTRHFAKTEQHLADAGHRCSQTSGFEGQMS